MGATYSPAQIFRQFIADKAVKVVCHHTNLNAEREHAKGKKFVWEELKSVNFLVYVGLMIYMALVKLPRVRDYWRKGSHLSVHFPASVMTRDRFMAISRTTHMSNPEHDTENDRKKGTPDYDPLHRLQPLYTTIRQACKALWQPRKHIAIDERMVATKAKTGLRQYMKVKPTKWSVKLFVLVDSSNRYTSDFSIYTGKSRFISGRGLSHDVVKQKHSSSRSPRGSIQWIREQELLFVKWMDMREVSVCSTIHQAFDGNTVTRNVHDKETGRWQKKKHHRTLLCGGLQQVHGGCGTF